MNEATGGIALLFSVAAVVVGLVRFHRARTALREASRDRMNQLMAEMAHHAEPTLADKSSAYTPDDDHRDSAPSVLSEHDGPTAVDGAPDDADGSGALVEGTSEPEVVEPEAVEPEAEPEPRDVRREMDAFFGGSLPPQPNA